MSEWDINKPLGQCFGTNRTIDPGEEYVGALVRTEEGLQRRDFCAEYWESEKPDVFCYWKTKLPHPDQKKQLFVDDQMLMAFFERLEKETEPEKINFRFVLALILMRKRILKYQQTDIRDGQEFWIMGQVREQTIHEVLNPNLDEAQIQEVSEQLSSILRSQL